MSLGEVSQISEGIYAYLQPDGGWWLNNTGLLVSDNSVISVDATSTERRTRAYLDAIAAVTDLHRAYLELEGGVPGAPVDLGLALADMVAYNGGRPLACQA
jgi:hypothetical protein